MTLSSYLYCVIQISMMRGNYCDPQASFVYVVYSINHLDLLKIILRLHCITTAFVFWVHFDINFDCYPYLYHYLTRPWRKLEKPSNPALTNNPLMLPKGLHFLLFCHVDMQRFRLQVPRFVMSPSV